MYNKKPIKLLKSEKETLLRIIEDEILKTVKVKKMASRIDVRAGRAYIYEKYEPTQMEGAVYTKPLIDGKYLELPYLRITLFNRDYTDCTLDYQRYNEQWMTLYSGTLGECISEAEESEWFE
jgi:hypothetical protein